ncbi:MAG: porin [Armatimonadota bacterium]
MSEPKRPHSGRTTKPDSEIRSVAKRSYGKAIFAAVLAIIAIEPQFWSVAKAEDLTAHSWQSYTQVRYTDSEDKGNYLSLRRLKLFGEGPISADWKYYLQFIYKANNHSLTDDRPTVQDASATLDTTKGKLTVGQFKPPFGMERFVNSYVMPLVERSQATDRLIPNGSLDHSFTRDYGVQWQTKTPSGLTLTSGLFVGNGANNSFGGNGPLLVARVAHDKKYQANRRLRAEIAASWRRDANIDFRAQIPGAPAGYAEFSGQDVRQDLAVAYEWPKNSLRTEYIAAQYRPNISVPRVNADAAYVEWDRDLSSRWQGAVRYEIMNPNTPGGVDKSFRWINIGAVYRIHSYRERVQIDYVIKREGTAEIGNNALVVQYQRFFW